MLVIGRSYVLSIQVDETITGEVGATKLKLDRGNNGVVGIRRNIVLYCIVFAARTEP